MKPIVGTMLFFALLFGPFGAAWSMDESDRTPTKLAQAEACPQVIHCGIKDGKAKEYPTPCAAEDDGATNIAPKTGGTCPEIE